MTETEHIVQEYSFSLDLDAIRQRIFEKFGVHVEMCIWDGITLKVRMPADLTEMQRADLNLIVKNTAPFLVHDSKRDVKVKMRLE